MQVLISLQCEQIASLAIRSGNGLLLKGGKEARRSNAILHKVITSAIPESVGGGLIGLVTTRDEIPELLKLDDVIDLVIPRGSNKLVSQIKSSTKIPVLGHADGVCHVYVDKSADMEMAKNIVVDAKTDYPAACNAMVYFFLENRDVPL
ncbi:putative glutamate-5-semialdehyde dehydrogenase, Glutamate 5-kinase [Helianthus anomalus]